MDIEDVVRDLSIEGGGLPRASMQWALDNWDAAEPRFIELLDRCGAGIDRSEQTKRGGNARSLGAQSICYGVHCAIQSAKACGVMWRASARAAMWPASISRSLTGSTISTLGTPSSRWVMP